MNGEKGTHIISGKVRRKEQPGRPRCRWEDNIKMDFGDIG
jgi:hypothetical protein